MFPIVIPASSAERQVEDSGTWIPRVQEFETLRRSNESAAS
jgi:hypothetical protein